MKILIFAILAVLAVSAYILWAIVTEIISLYDDKASPNWHQNI